MEPRELARLYAFSRIGLGGLVLLIPGLAGGWVGSDARRPGTRVLARGFAARDVALGVGLWRALERDAPVRGWLEGSALADAADFTATLIGGRDLPGAGRLGGLVLAGSGAALGGYLAQALSAKSS